MKRGERITVLDGTGNELLCAVENAAKDSLALAVLEKKFTPAPACPVTLLVAIPKGKIIESIIQKAVELGAHRIVPLLTERVVTQLDDEGAESKREKWRQVAVEAIKQCGAAWLPIVELPQTISEFLGRGSAEHRLGPFSKPQPAGTVPGAPNAGSVSFDLHLVGSLQTERRHPRVWFEQFQQQYGRLPRSVGVWIGPEGDFTLAELHAIEAAGAKPITLGALTLRVETAAIYCLAFLNYELSR